MSNIEISEKIIYWQLVEYPEFEVTSPQEKTTKLKLMKDWSEGVVPLPDGMKLEKYEVLKKLAGIKYFYFLKMSDQVGITLDIQLPINQVEFFDDILDK